MKQLVGWSLEGMLGDCCEPGMSCYSFMGICSPLNKLTVA
jgi:hypothetical protein